MKQAALAILALSLPHTAQAAEQCPLRVLGIGNTWIISGYGTSCEVRRIATPSLPCHVRFDHDHGLHSFSCENGLSGHWASGTFGSDANSLSFSGASAPTKFPRHAKERSTWLAAIDEEGLYKSYPIEMDEYYKHYPKEIIHTGDIHKIDNPEFAAAMQSYRYTTMQSSNRVAIAGSIVRECITLRFVTWVKPQKAKITERHMSEMLSGLRLELVTDSLPEKRRTWICKTPSEQSSEHESQDGGIREGR